MPATIPLKLEQIFALAYQALCEHGCDHDNADALADTIMRAERDGSVSHGLFRLPAYIKALKSGKANPSAKPKITQATASLIKCHGDNGFAPIAQRVALPHLITAAKTQGIAMLAITHTHHMAALWPEVEASSRAKPSRIRVRILHARSSPRRRNQSILRHKPHQLRLAKTQQPSHGIRHGNRLPSHGRSPTSRQRRTQNPRRHRTRRQRQPNNRPRKNSQWRRTTTLRRLQRRRHRHDGGTASRRVNRRSILIRSQSQRQRRRRPTTRRTIHPSTKPRTHRRKRMGKTLRGILHKITRTRRHKTTRRTPTQKPSRHRRTTHKQSPHRNHRQRNERRRRYY